MARIIYKIDMMATLRAMETGEEIVIASKECVPEITVRCSASKLRPMHFSVKKTAEGIRVSRTS